MSSLSAPHFHDEEAAYGWVEARLWPNGPVCPRCKGTDRIRKLAGKSTRIGVHFCNACRKHFTVKVGTVLESSHIPLRLWLQAIALLCASKKGMSSNQLHRTLGITPKSAWFLSHRIREAMAGGLAPLGGSGAVVEMDETYFGKASPRPLARGRVPNPTKGGRSGPGGKRAVVALVERGGPARAVHVRRVSAENVADVLAKHADPASRLHLLQVRRRGGGLSRGAEARKRSRPRPGGMRSRAPP